MAIGGGCCPHRCELQCLLDPTPCDRRSPEIDGLFGTIKHRVFRVGERIFRSGDRPAAITKIETGLVKLLGYTENGAESIVLLAGSDSAIGLEALLERPMRYEAVAIQPTRACGIPVRVLEKLGANDAGLQRRLMSLWQANLEFAGRSLSRYSRGAIALRVLRLITDLASRDTVDGVLEVTLFRRQDMAAIMGVSPENISRAIAGFQRKKLLRKLKRDVYRCDLSRISRMTAWLEEPTRDGPRPEKRTRRFAGEGA